MKPLLHTIPNTLNRNKHTKSTKANATRKDPKDADRNRRIRQFLHPLTNPPNIQNHVRGVIASNKVQLLQCITNHIPSKMREYWQCNASYQSFATRDSRRWQGIKIARIENEQHSSSAR